MARARHRLEKAAKPRLEQVYRIEFWSAGAVLALVFWLAIFDWRDWSVVAALLLAPPLALAVLIPLRAHFADLPPGARPFLFGPTMLVPPVLVLAARREFNFLDGYSYDWALLAAAAALALLIPRARKTEGETPARLRVWNAAAVLFVGLVYADGAVKLLDVGLDTAAPATYRTTVTGKEEIHHWYLRRGEGTRGTRWLSLSPWGPDRVTAELEVSVYLYDSVKAGSTLCARLHGGYLGLRWYEIERC